MSPLVELWWPGTADTSWSVSSQTSSLFLTCLEAQMKLLVCRDVCFIVPVSRTNCINIYED